MKIHQLFRVSIPREFVTRLLGCFACTADDPVGFTFTKMDLHARGTCEKMSQLAEQMREIYLPCKYKIYFENLNACKAITVLRQILRVFEYRLVSTQKYLRRRKISVYRIAASAPSDAETEADAASFRVISSNVTVRY
jgi:hypothetical protein